MKAAQKIQRVVEHRGTTLTFLSKKTGISVNKLSRTLRGLRQLQADELIALCRALDLTLDDLEKERT